MDENYSPGALLKPMEVAAFLNVSLASVYRWCSTGRLTSFKIGSAHGPLRIPAVAVEELLRAHVADSVAGDAVGVEREQRVDA